MQAQSFRVGVLILAGCYGLFYTASPGSSRLLAAIQVDEQPEIPPLANGVIVGHAVRPDVSPPLRDIKPTQGRAIDHIAFSYRQIEAVFERMKSTGAKIVQPIAMQESLKLKSFFVLAPDDVLVEIVEAKPIPEGAWDD